ncbi:hypothetical protein ColLi_13097 [Colletotrichum liriopes]|uniref:Uncharacterized protein n=1 Tax=Colletotrichum liriopes TaxID=708192 RepID=A0AA37H0G6_9PEZI|nr:hypothetical protein ColLi_13097 [Colletotrichum liriopes]
MLSRNIVLESKRLGKEETADGSRPTHDSDKTWAHCVRHGRTFMGEIWSLRPRPAAYASHHGNLAVAAALKMEYELATDHA